MTVETYKAMIQDLGESRPMRKELRDGFFSEYAENRLKAEFLLQQVNSRHIDMNSRLASELEILMERVSGQDRKISVV